MSFSSDTKNELARLELDKKCCMLAELAGFIRMCGSIRLAGGGRFNIVISTDIPAVARRFKRLIKDYFDVDAGLEIGEGIGIKKSKLYFLNIGADARSEQILRETGILMVKEGKNFISDGIYEGLIKTKCCRKSYLRGIFLGAGTVTEPEKSYHFEISCTTEKLAMDVKRLIAGFVDLKPKYAKRKYAHVIYIKEGEQIADLLNIIKAHGQLLKLEETRIIKALRNETNRISNCDNANLGKTLDAAELQIKAINSIVQNIGWEGINEKLREVAWLRLKNPQANLQELADMTDPPIKKSGVNHRLKKLVEISSSFNCSNACLK